jgi:hypothetical protein
VSDAPSLLPPASARDRALPRWALPVALLGLVVLFASTLPALIARRRLEHESRDLEAQVLATERRIEETRRERTAIETDSFVRERTLEELLSPGRTSPPPRRPR